MNLILCKIMLSGGQTMYSGRQTKKAYFDRDVNYEELLVKKMHLDGLIV